MPPLKVSRRDFARYAANVQPDDVAPPAPPRTRSRHDYKAEANRLRNVLAYVRRLLERGTPPARVVAVVDEAMQGIEDADTTPRQ